MKKRFILLILIIFSTNITNTKKGPLEIWILSQEKYYNSYSNRQMKAEAKKQNINVKLVNAGEIDIIESVPPTTNTTLPDCLLVRIGSDRKERALAKNLETKGVLVINKADAMKKSSNKFESMQYMAANNLPIPKTILASFPIDIEKIKKYFGFPVVAKSCYGSHGKKVMLCRNEKDIQKTRKLTGENNVIFQELVSDSYGRDIRVLIIDGKAVGAMLRQAPPGKFKSNFSAGGSVKQFKLTPRIKKLAEDTAKAHDLEIAGVDILFDGNDYKICEINSNPGIKGFEQATHMNIWKKIFTCIKEKFKN
ncbi:RimK family alpha-L-glutamate ligase [bacterium]|jgi:gamma-F420-2:alpha-L-glutamate ligase|nr:RimK family alpha-L-glutamate ligase [bacterium]